MLLLLVESNCNFPFYLACFDLGTKKPCSRHCIPDFFHMSDAMEPDNQLIQVRFFYTALQNQKRKDEVHQGLNKFLLGQNKLKKVI